MVLLGPNFLEIAPFQATPSPPMVFAPAPAAPFGTPAARALKAHMPTGPGHGTVRWHTPGLDRRTRQEWERAEEARLYRDDLRYSFGVRAGLAVYHAAPPILRDWARAIHAMGAGHDWGSHAHLAAWSHWPRRDEGEMRVLPHFREDTEQLRRARDEVLASPDSPDDPLLRQQDTFARAFGPPAPPVR
ncbi:hypothetical protein [Halostreptopolyspora alba]|uniref:Uncharacterized protein n=1 Tax=Halostreptopolyspora alba TaxID=2487137 RepID=A0A3N0EH11_9ACTN|nr:hypothetical protein EFW17_03610 [Nocardiopsaceae bacterium YIM 96095]